MNKEQTQECIRIMQAFVDGKEIQTKGHGQMSWFDNPSPDWIFDKADYRIKPKPKIIYVNEYWSGDVDAFTEETKAQKYNSVAGNIAVPYIRLSDVELLK